MMLHDAFRPGDRTFYDNKNFPYGFRKSGDFTIKESDHLSLYGQVMAGLAAGELEPVSPPEGRFIRVCRGEAEAETTLEKVWLKYITLTNYPRRFYSLNGTSRAQGQSDDTQDTESSTEMNDLSDAANSESDSK